MATLTRRRLLQSAALTASGAPFLFTRNAGAAAGGVTPRGKMTLAWHTNIAPRWLDPGQHDGSATPDNFITIVHDALIKNHKDKLYDHLALAEEFEFPEDAGSATFRLRPDIYFHDGSPVTPEDVKWSYENYRGAWAQVLHERTDRITFSDKRTVRFEFKGPFLDFPRLMGTANVCGAAWVVPAKYVEKVGGDGFVARPIGAGPYKLVNHEPGTRLDFEAFEGYYAPVHVKEFTIVSAPDTATRIAMVERGEADITYGLSGELVPRIQRSRTVMLAPVVSGSFWLRFPGFQNPNNPFHDMRVREAVSLTIDRDAINRAECAGLGQVSGNWINNDVEYALEWPKWEHNLEKAKKLLAEAGYPNGFEYDWLTPAPPYYSRGERALSQLQAVGIRGRLQSLERGVYNKRRQGGMKEWPGVNIIFEGARIGASWANWYESLFRCGGRLAGDMMCVANLDTKFERYTQSENATERERLAHEIQREILENHYFVPVFRHAFMNAIGPRIDAKDWKDVFPTITTGYAYPWEEIKLKSSA
jgi:peptide/nickel transport system substrate-binding protein